MTTTTAISRFDALRLSDNWMGAFYYDLLARRIYLRAKRCKPHVPCNLRYCWDCQVARAQRLREILDQRLADQPWMVVSLHSRHPWVCGPNGLRSLREAARKIRTMLRPTGSITTEETVLLHQRLRPWRVHLHILVVGTWNTPALPLALPGDTYTAHMSTTAEALDAVIEAPVRTLASGSEQEAEQMIRLSWHQRHQPIVLATGSLRDIPQMLVLRER